MNALSQLERKLRTFTVGARIIAILALILLPMAALSIVSMIVLNDQEIDFQRSVQESIDTLLPLTTLEHYLERALVDELEAESDTPTPNFATLTRNIDRTFSNIETSASSPDLPKNLISAAQQAWRDARPSVERLVEHVRPLSPAYAHQPGERQSRRDLQQAIQDIGRARQHLASIVRARYMHAAALRNTQLEWLVWGWVVTLSIAAVFIGLFLHSILKPIKELEWAARRFGAGDANVHVPVVGSDELAAVSERFNEMAAYWQNTRQALITETSIDPLTGILNRRGISAALEAELPVHRSRQQPLSLFIMDLDKFKAINDSFGHSAGDRALVWVAEKMRETLRDSDCLGRYGGDEFLAVLPNTTVEQAQQIARRMEHVIRSGTAKEPSYPTVSIGIASAPRDGWTSTELIGSADTRLYEEKAKRPSPTQAS